MKGKVEVFVIAADGSEKLILSEPNLIVDGAAQSIVDMFTCPSSVLSVSPRVVDTSNWRWGAISFGPAASSFQENAYFFPSNGVYQKTDDLCNGVSVDITSYINQIGTDYILRPLWVSGTIGADNGATASSYTPPFRLPSYPDPLDQKLEDARTAYAIVSGDGTQCFGQFENRMFFASGDPSSYFQGVYPLSGDEGNQRWQTSAMLVSSYEGDFSVNPLSKNVVVSSPQAHDYAAIGYTQVGSSYNINSVMDYRGFIETQYAIAGSFSHGRAGVSGIVVSNDASALCSDPRVVMETTIFCSDLWAMNLYGGLHQIGLWSLDTPKTLLADSYRRRRAIFDMAQSTVSAPFAWIDPNIGPNPNKMNYTVDTALDPDITFNTDLAGTWGSWGSPPRLSTFSGVEYTNPFGGVSSLIWSGVNEASEDWGALAQHPDNNPRLPVFGAASSICLSVYVKEYDDPAKAANSFGINIYDGVDGNHWSYNNWFEWIGGEPVEQGSGESYETTKIEDVGDGWYRCSMSVAGLGNTAKTDEGDRMRAIFYFGSQVAASTRNGIANKLMYWYAPQVEQHTTVGAPALPSPYQAVRLATPAWNEMGNSKGITPREYRLFAKKTFTENLCQVKDSGTYSGFLFSAGTGDLGGSANVNLKIRWIIDFRSQHD